MSATERTSAFSRSDFENLAAYVFGMIMFWVSGQAGSQVLIKLPPAMASSAGPIIMACTIGTFVLGMLVFNALMLGRSRALKPILISGFIIAFLGFGGSWGLSHASSVFAGKYLLFLMVAYVAFGVFYVIGWQIARRLAR